MSYIFTTGENHGKKGHFYAVSGCFRVSPEGPFRSFSEKRPQNNKQRSVDNRGQVSGDRGQGTGDRGQGTVNSRK